MTTKTELIAGVETFTPFEYWSMEDNRISMQQGWLLTNDSAHRVLIAKVDDPAAVDDLDYTEPKFKYDEEAQAFVAKVAGRTPTRTDRGSRTALLALYLQGSDINGNLNMHPPFALLAQSVKSKLNGNILFIPEDKTPIAQLKGATCFTLIRRLPNNDEHTMGRAVYSWELDQFEFSFKFSDGSPMALTEIEMELLMVRANEKKEEIHQGDK